MLVAAHKLDVDSGSEQVYKEIVLTRGHIALVDTEDFDRVNAFNWHANVQILKSGITYVRATRQTKRRNVYLHHQVLNIMPWDLGEDEEIDHRDKNPLHCFKSNLRVVTHLENMANSVLAYTSRGVCFNKRAKLWMAYLAIPIQPRKYLGYYKTEVQALEAVEKAKC